ncbi:oxygenase [Lithospermum erythrorhizon]|uniref:Oxygenase n=1 Tax=Lithospermum erythrorhizon TaxID=34254 RepID=A0AAV3QL85_LITER
MDSIIITIVISLLFALTLLQTIFFSSRKNKKNLPPGPTPFPIIGNLHQVGSQPHKSFTKLGKIYGPIIRLELGRVTTIVISSPSIAKEILQKQDPIFSAVRGVPDAMHASNHFKYSAVWIPANSHWRSLRKILATNIFSNSRLEANQHLRFKKVQELIAFCGKSCENGSSIKIGEAVFRTSLNLLSNTIFSTDFADYYSTKATEFKDAVWNIVLNTTKPNMVDFFPILRKIDPQGIRRRCSGEFKKVLKIMDGLISERLEQRKANGRRSEDVLDEFLNYIEDHPGEIDFYHMKHTILDLFIAGTDTTSSSTEWGMAELMRHPDIMKKAKCELEDVIGKGKTITENDVARLPYLRCIVKEILRIHPGGPFLVPRKPTEDVVVHGYTIPKDSNVLISTWALGRDPSLWQNPLEFRPERFENSEVDVRGHNFELIPFGAGRRICPGMPLALKMIPLMLGSLINTFNWTMAPGMIPEDINMEEEVGLTIQMAHSPLLVPLPL